MTGRGLRTPAKLPNSIWTASSRFDARRFLRPRKTRETVSGYTDLSDVIRQAAQNIFQPPNRMSVSEAAEEYRYINNRGQFVGKWKNAETPYMVEPMDVLNAREFDSCVFVGPAQCGKGLALDTPLPTPTGWTTMGEVAVNDWILGRNGRPTRVLALSPVRDDLDCYRITFDDDSTIIADSVHRWSVNDMWARDPYALRMVDTAYLFGRYEVSTKKGSRFRFSIPTADPIVRTPRTLPVSPYCLGVWLGDGTTATGSVTLGQQDAKFIGNRFSSEYSSIVEIGKGNSVGTADRLTSESFVASLRAAGLIGHKRIPLSYTRAATSQRRELVRGMMDTDGTADDRGRCSWSSSLPELADQMYELLVSLGIKVHRDDKIPTYQNGEGQRSYRLSFNVDDPEDVFSLPRHIAKLRAFSSGKVRRPTHSGRRFIRKIEKIEKVPTRCLAVEAEDHLFLAGRQMVPTHNTDALIINWTLFSAVVDPMDLIIYSPSGAAAKDFSVRRIDRLVRDSKDVKAALLTDKDADGKFQKQFKSGVLLTLSWPSTNELSGKPVGRVAITDYDRIDDDIGGEGSAYDLGKKRTTTFGSFAMTLAESSPSREVEDPSKILSSPHEAPPCKGILSLYNRGDRRLWYWPCPQCGNHFSPRFEMLKWSKVHVNHSDIADTAKMECPHCLHKIAPGHRQGMQQLGMWLREGEAIIDGERVGSPRRAKIASFWLEGTAARFTTWPKLVLNYLDAKKELDDTGSEEALKKFYNTDLGRPYVSQSMLSNREPLAMKARAEPLPFRKVPVGVRALVASIDVQMNRFVVQVHGIIPGRPHDIVIVDRFDVVKSLRLDADGDPYAVRPGSYQEDWDLLIGHVLEKQYELDDDSGRSMGIKLTLCDSGGEANAASGKAATGSGGVTSNAYAFWRSLRKQGMAHRFHLVKGDGNPNAPRVRIDMPDTRDRKNLARAQGDVPVMFLNSNGLKDTLANLLDVMEPGKGLIRWPDWLDDRWYDELCAEVRTEKGWDAKRKRNEAWDLLYYVVGAGFSAILPLHKVDWSNPPAWLADWDANSLVTSPVLEEAPVKAKDVERKGFSFADLGRQLAGNGA